MDQVKPAGIKMVRVNKLNANRDLVHGITRLNIYLTRSIISYDIYSVKTNANVQHLFEIYLLYSFYI